MKDNNIAVKELYFDKLGFSLWIQSNGEEQDGNLLHIHIGKLNAYINLPKLINAREKKVVPNWDEETIKRLGRDYYTEYIQKQFGFTFTDEHIHTYYGIQPGSWSRRDKANSDHTKLFSYPWNWYHVRHSCYFTNGEYACDGDHFFNWEHVKNGRVIPNKEDVTRAEREKAFCTTIEFEYPKSTTYKAPRAFENTKYDNWSEVFTDQPVYAFFTFTDPFDNNKTIARVNIEEREWVRGIYKWMHPITKHLPFCKMVKRSLDIWFMDEVGYRKGSWKGGTLGMGYAMLPNETLEEAWKRFVTDQKEITHFKQR